jgi:hypothetical protein
MNEQWILSFRRTCVYKLSLAKQRRFRGVSEVADGSARDVKPDYLVVG